MNIPSDNAANGFIAAVSVAPSYLYGFVSGDMAYISFAMPFVLFILGKAVDLVIKPYVVRWMRLRRINKALKGKE